MAEFVSRKSHIRAYEWAVHARIDQSLLVLQKRIQMWVLYFGATFTIFINIDSLRIIFVYSSDKCVIFAIHPAIDWNGSEFSETLAQLWRSFTILCWFSQIILTTILCSYENGMGFCDIYVFNSMDSKTICKIALKCHAIRLDSCYWKCFLYDKTGAQKQNGKSWKWKKNNLHFLFKWI